MSERTSPGGNPVTSSQNARPGAPAIEPSEPVSGPRHRAPEEPAAPAEPAEPIEPAQPSAGVPADPGDPSRDPGTSAESVAAETSEVRADATSEADSGGDAGVESGADPEASDHHGAKVRHWRDLSRKRNSKAKRPWWIELPILIVIAFVLTFLIQTFVARVYYVPSGSMEHTLHGVTSGGDRILAFKMLYDFRDPEQGEVVVFKGPATWTPEANIPGPSTWIGKVGQALGSVVGIAPPNEKDYVKRVIAVGGQTIRCCDAQGRVQVNGTSLHEPYIFMDADKPTWAWVDGESSCDRDPANPAQFQSFRCFGPYTVPKGTVWVMGDHRSDSADSSYQCRGLVPSPNVHCQGPIPVDDVIGKAVAIVMPPSRWGSVGSPDIMSSSNGALGAATITIAPSGTMPAVAPFALSLLGAWGVRRLSRRRRSRHRTARSALRSSALRLRRDARPPLRRRSRHLR